MLVVITPSFLHSQFFVFLVGSPQREEPNWRVGAATKCRTFRSREKAMYYTEFRDFEVSAKVGRKKTADGSRNRVWTVLTLFLRVKNLPLQVFTINIQWTYLPFLTTMSANEDDGRRRRTLDSAKQWRSSASVTGSPSQSEYLRELQFSACTDGRRSLSLDL